jgi:hypothetical protein
LQLTTAGQRLNRAMAGTVEAIVRSTLRQIDDRDRRVVRRTLELLAERLDGAPAGMVRSRTRSA